MVTSVAHLLHGFLCIYRPQKDERLSWPGWLTYSRQFTHKVVTCQAVNRAKNTEMSLVRIDVLPTVLHSRPT